MQEYWGHRLILLICYGLSEFPAVVALPVFNPINQRLDPAQYDGASLLVLVGTII